MKTFRFRYLLGENKVPAAWDYRCSSPITALNHFHRHMQIDFARRPDDYVLSGMFEIYNDDATGRGRGNVVESKFDLPETPNPDVRPFAVNPTPQTMAEFPFVNERMGGKLAE